MNKLIGGLLAVMLAFVIIALLLIYAAAPAQAIMVNETCLDANTLFVSFEYNLDVDGENTIYKWNQTHECTNECSDNKCNVMDAGVDMSAMWITFVAGLIFLVIGTIMGVPFGKIVGKEEITAGWDTTMMVRYIFFFIGFYLVYLSFGMSRRVSAVYGGDENITDAAGTATMVMRITMTLFLIMMFVETLFYILKYYQNVEYVKKWGYGD